MAIVEFRTPNAATQAQYRAPEGTARVQLNKDGTVHSAQSVHPAKDPGDKPLEAIKGEKLVSNGIGADPVIVEVDTAVVRQMESNNAFSKPAPAEVGKTISKIA